MELEKLDKKKVGAKTLIDDPRKIDITP